MERGIELAQFGLAEARRTAFSLKPSLIEESGLIAALQKQARGRIIVMPGGGLTPRNIEKIVAFTGVAEVHLSARRTIESGMTHRNSRVFMGGTLRPPEFSWKTTDEASVRTVVEALRKTS